MMKGHKKSGIQRDKETAAKNVAINYWEFLVVLVVCAQCTNYTQTHKARLAWFTEFNVLSSLERWKQSLALPLSHQILPLHSIQKSVINLYGQISCHHWSRGCLTLSLSGVAQNTSHCHFSRGAFMSSHTSNALLKTQGTQLNLWATVATPAIPIFD